MRKFAEEYPYISIVQEPLAQTTGYHNKIVKSIPKNLKPSLPSIKDIERELSKETSKKKNPS